MLLSYWMPRIQPQMIIYLLYRRYFWYHISSNRYYNAYIFRRAISYQEHASQFLLKNLVFLIDLGVILIGGCSTLCLTVMHLYVAIFNVTTWEFMSSHRISYLKDCDYSQSPFHLGYLQNFLVFMFAGNVQDWKAIYQKNFKKSNPECLLVV